MWATEEIILPALVTLAGLDVLRNPCSHDYVCYRRPYTTAHVDAASRRADVFWLHPVLRRYDDPVRARVRARYGNYAAAAAGDAAPSFDRPSAPQPLTTLSLLRRMEDIPGWLSRGEADLLAGSVLQAVSTTPAPHHIIEIGSYCGRSTVVLGTVAQAVDQQATVYAVDPHEGTISGAASRRHTGTPPFTMFLANMVAAEADDGTSARAGEHGAGPIGPPREEVAAVREALEQWAPQLQLAPCDLSRPDASRRGLGPVGAGQHPGAGVGAQEGAEVGGVAGPHGKLV